MLDYKVKEKQKISKGRNKTQVKDRQYYVQKED